MIAGDGGRARMPGMITIATFSNREAAHLLRTQLESAGIPAYVLHDTDWLSTNDLVSGVPVQIAEEDEERAREFLAALPLPQAEPPTGETQP